MNVFSQKLIALKQFESRRLAQISFKMSLQKPLIKSLRKPEELIMSPQKVEDALYAFTHYDLNLDVCKVLNRVRDANGTTIAADIVRKYPKSDINNWFSILA